MDEEIYHRLNGCERDLHTLKHRMEVLEGEKLVHRITSLEGSVAQMTKDVGRIESKASEIAEQVRAMKANLKGVLWTLTALVTLIQILPLLKGLML